MKFTRLEELAILFTSELAASESTLSVSSMAEKHGISPLFLKKITSSLKRAGIITSREGSGGGYALAASPSKLTVTDVLVAISSDPLMQLMKHEHMNACPLRTTCLPEVVRLSMWSAVGNALQSITITDLITSKKEHI
jgi:Rrf2 family protein